MMEQFQDVLQTPRPSSGQLLNKMQDLILSTMEDLLPSSFDFSYLSTIYDEELGPNRAQELNQGHIIQLTIEQQISLNHRLITYFIDLMKTNFIRYEIYEALQEQTQKSQATIRSHIKVEQEMKMYLEYLQAKIHRYEKQLEESGPDICAHLQKQIQLLKSRESILYREKVNLIKKAQELSSQLEYVNYKMNQSHERHTKKPILTETTKFIKFINNLRMMQEEKKPYQGKRFQNNEDSSENVTQKECFGYQPTGYELTQKKQSAYFPEII